MSKTRRPPDVLRKSHPHLDSDERARLKRELLDAIDEAAYDDDGAGEADNREAEPADGESRANIRRDADVHGAELAEDDS